MAFGCDAAQRVVPLPYQLLKATTTRGRGEQAGPLPPPDARYEDGVRATH